MAIQVTTAVLGPLLTNTYLVEVGERLLLVDPAANEPTLRALVGDRRVNLVVDTHGHFDHIGGNWVVPSDAVCIHEADAELASFFYPNHPPFQRLLRDGEELAPGVRVLHTPGHSPGSVVLVMDGILFTGDLLFAGSVGRTDLPGSSDAEMEESLQKLLRLAGDYVVYPGHGGATTLDRERRTNPFLRGLG